MPYREPAPLHVPPHPSRWHAFLCAVGFHDLLTEHSNEPWTHSGSVISWERCRRAPCSYRAVHTVYTDVCGRAPDPVGEKDLPEGLRRY